MPDNQSQGRNDNDAIPESEAKDVRSPKSSDVSAEQASFKPDQGGASSPNDLTGPAGDPAEGKR